MIRKELKKKKCHRRFFVSCTNDLQSTHPYRHSSSEAFVSCRTLLSSTCVFLSAPSPQRNGNCSPSQTKLSKLYQDLLYGQIALCSSRLYLSLKLRVTFMIEISSSHPRKEIHLFVAKERGLAIAKIFILACLSSC